MPFQIVTLDRIASHNMAQLFCEKQFFFMESVVIGSVTTTDAERCECENIELDAFRFEKYRIFWKNWITMNPHNRESILHVLVCPKMKFAPTHTETHETECFYE